MHSISSLRMNGRIVPRLAVLFAAVLVGCAAYLKYFSFERITFDTMHGVSTGNEHGIRFVHGPKVLALISSRAVSYSDSKKLLLREAVMIGASELTIYRGPLWGIEKKSFGGTVIAFGDTWQKTAEMTQPLVTVYAVMPLLPPPREYPYDNLAVILGHGSEFKGVNDLWRVWCRTHGVPFAELDESGVQAIETAFDDFRKAYPSLMNERQLKRAELEKRPSR